MNKASSHLQYRIELDVGKDWIAFIFNKQHCYCEPCICLWNWDSLIIVFTDWFLRTRKKDLVPGASVVFWKQTFAFPCNWSQWWFGSWLDIDIHSDIRNSTCIYSRSTRTHATTWMNVKQPNMIFSLSFLCYVTICRLKVSVHHYMFSNYMFYCRTTSQQAFSNIGHDFVENTCKFSLNVPIAKLIMS